MLLLFRASRCLKELSTMQKNSVVLFLILLLLSPAVLANDRSDSSASNSDLENAEVTRVEKCVAKRLNNMSLITAHNIILNANLRSTIYEQVALKKSISEHRGNSIFRIGETNIGFQYLGDDLHRLTFPDGGELYFFVNDEEATIDVDEAFDGNCNELPITSEESIGIYTLYTKNSYERLSILLSSLSVDIVNTGVEKCRIWSTSCSAIQDNSFQCFTSCK